MYKRFILLPLLALPTCASAASQTVDCDTLPDGALYFTQMFINPGVQGNQLYNNGRMTKGVEISYQAFKDTDQQCPATLTSSQLLQNIHIGEHALNSIPTPIEESRAGFHVSTQPGQFEHQLPRLGQHQVVKEKDNSSRQQNSTATLWLSYARTEGGPLTLQVELCAYALGPKVEGEYLSNCTQNTSGQVVPRTLQVVDGNYDNQDIDIRDSGITVLCSTADSCEGMASHNTDIPHPPGPPGIPNLPPDKKQKQPINKQPKIAWYDVVDRIGRSILTLTPGQHKAGAFLGEYVDYDHQYYRGIAIGCMYEKNGVCTDEGGNDPVLGYDYAHTTWSTKYSYMTEGVSVAVPSVISENDSSIAYQVPVPVPGNGLELISSYLRVDDEAFLPEGATGHPCTYKDTDIMDDYGNFITLRLTFEQSWRGCTWVLPQTLQVFNNDYGPLRMSRAGSVNSLVDGAQ